MRLKNAVYSDAEMILVDDERETRNNNISDYYIPIFSITSLLLTLERNM